MRTEGKEAGEEQIANSFHMFKTDYIDLFQLHNMVDYRTHIPTLTRLKEEGKIGLVGVSAMVHEAYPEIIELMKSHQVDTIQIPYNVVGRGCEDELLPLAEELGIGVLVMEPLKKGRYVNELKSQPDLSPLAEFGVKTWAQALLSWVLGPGRFPGQHCDPRNVPARANPGKRSARNPGTVARRTAGLRKGRDAALSINPGVASVETTSPHRLDSGIPTLTTKGSYDNTGGTQGSQGFHDERCARSGFVGGQG